MERPTRFPVFKSFWEELAAGKRSELNQGRLMSAFSFSESWSMWERHPAGDEWVMLLSGPATSCWRNSARSEAWRLDEPGSYVLVPRDVWHMARTAEPR